MKSLLFLNNLRWYWRWPTKTAVFVFSIVAVCYPYPHLLVRQIGRLANPNSLIEPDSPALRPLIDDLTP